MKVRWLLVPAVILVSACHGNNAVSTAPEYNPSVITEKEIDASGAVTAYDAIKKLHANFLTYRGTTTLANTSSPEPLVYVDDQLFGLVSALKQIPSLQVSEIRLYRAWEATQKYGNGVMGGVIAITTRK